MIYNIQVLRAVPRSWLYLPISEVLLSILGLPRSGWTGVDLFFVISGLIIVYTTSQKPTPALTFFSHRIARIVPIYWLLTIVVFAIALVAPNLFQGTHATPGQLAKSLLFIPDQRADGRVEPLLFVGWTLNFEMFFYLVFTVGLTFRRRLTGVLASVAFLVVLVIAGLVFRPTGVLAAFYSRPIMLEFGFGMLIGLALPIMPAQLPAAAKIGLVVLTAVALITIAISPVVFPTGSSVICNGLPAAIAVASAAALERAGWAIRNPILVGLGAASYSIYLIHPFVTQVVQKVGHAMHVQGLKAIGLLIICFGAVAVVGTLVYRLIEKPLSIQARKLLETLNGSKAQAPVVR
jgi:exopolysaccharide production protein ExoZ